MDKDAGSNIKILQSVNFNKIIITYQNKQSTFDLAFKIRKTTIAQRWANKLELAKSLYTIDDPKRFYGFGSRKEQIEDALKKINNCCDIINSYQKIIDRRLYDIHDSDTLNYLHHIFEVYHGLLDAQNHPYYLNAPIEVKNALANLNVLVHRCESITRSQAKRQVITYYGLPKTDTLDWLDYELLESNLKFGTIYLVYCEIGKTLKDLAIDNDHYISDEAYKPFRFFSADFEIYFTDNPQSEKINKLVQDYYNKNSEFFISRKLPLTHPYNKMGKLPVADIDNPPENWLELLESHQNVKDVTLIKE